MIEISSQYIKNEENVDISIFLKQNGISKFEYTIINCSSQVAALYCIKIGLTKLLKNYSDCEISIKTNQYCNNVFTNENCNISANRDLINNIQLLINQFKMVLIAWVDLLDNQRTPYISAYKTQIDNYEIKSR